MKNNTLPFNKNRIAVFALLLYACGFIFDNAHAQSSVNIGGVLAESLMYTTNYGGSSRTAVVSNARSPSILWFGGAEDLGEGKKATFRLEMRLLPSTGALFENSRAFGAESYIGLEDKKSGTIRLGRQIDLPVYLLFWQPSLNNILAMTPGNADMTAGEYVNDAISYTSPSLGGWTLRSLYAFGQHNGDAPTGRTVEFSTTYVSQKFMFSTAFSSKNGAVVTPTLFGAKTFLGNQVMPYAPVMVDEQRVIGASGQYAITPKTMLQGGLSYVRYTRQNLETSLKTLSLGVGYNLTPMTRVTPGYMYSNFDGAKYQMASLFLGHQLSKRTEVYAGIFTERTSGKNITATLFTQMPSTNNRQTAFDFGVLHAF